MTSRLSLTLVVLFVGAAPLAALQAHDPGRLYGRVVNDAGVEYVGFLRWGDNEGHWTDHIDATKRLPRRFRREAEQLTGESFVRERPRRILGIRVGWDRESTWSNTAESVIRFGHIRQIQTLDSRHGLVVLRSGEEQELRAGTSDLGGRLTITVYEPGARVVEVDWSDLDYVEFLPAPDIASPLGPRLHGTLVTVGDLTFTGWITWDRDEVFGIDELDGYENGGSREIPFANVAAIERVGSRRSRVTLRAGDVIELTGTNDVNNENRGIFVSDAALGRVEVDWDDFVAVRFHPPEGFAYDIFDGGHPLRGTVTTTDGRDLSGAIRWDNDEWWSWETLDGNTSSFVLAVEFGAIAAIEPVGMDRARITLRDGRTFLLAGSNDVNEANKGIFVRLDNGETVLVHWDEVRRTTFVH